MLYRPARQALLREVVEKARQREGVETAPTTLAGVRQMMRALRAGRGMVLFHTTDETWRWRRRIGDLYFARYWVQALRQLATAKGSGKPAVLRVAKDEYDVGKPVALEVRYQDERLAPADGNQ